jgi:hypothetical protein
MDAKRLFDRPPRELSLIVTVSATQRHASEFLRAIEVTGAGGSIESSTRLSKT